MSEADGVQIDFYFGLGSRYSYLAFTQIARIEAQTGCSFRLLPLSSVELMNISGKTPFIGEPASGQYEKAYRERDVLRWAQYYGVPFAEPHPMPKDHRLMARSCHAAALQNQMRAYCVRLFDAVFRARLVMDEGLCANLAGELNLDRGLFCAAMANGAADRRARDCARQAADRGAFGVPTFFIDEDMYWGNDRLVLLEHRLAAINGLHRQHARTI